MMGPEPGKEDEGVGAGVGDPEDVDRDESEIGGEDESGLDEEMGIAEGAGEEEDGGFEMGEPEEPGAMPMPVEDEAGGPLDESGGMGEAGYDSTEPL